VPHDHGHPDSERLAALVAGEALADAAALRAHVADCADCQARADALAGVGAALSDLPEPELPAGFHDRLIAAVRNESARLARAPGGAPDAVQPDASRREGAPAAGEPWLPAAGSADTEAPVRATASASGGPRTPASASAPASGAPIPLRRGGDGRATGGAAQGERARAAGRRRARGWLTRPATWAAAAAVLLVAIGAGNLALSTRERAEETSAARGGAPALSRADQGAAKAAAGQPPVRLFAAGDVSLASVRGDLARRPELREAYDQAASPSPKDAAGTRGQADNQRGGQAAAPEAAGPGGQPGRFAGDELRACLAAAGPGRPAFFLQGTYLGRPATILVTLEGSPPARMRLTAFARGDCATILGTEQGPPAPPPGR